MKKRVFGRRLKIYFLSLLLLIVFSFSAYYFLISKTKAQTFCSYESAIRKGYLESSAIDLGDQYTITQIMWKGRLENNTFVSFQLAGGNNINSLIFTGPDGTQNTYYTPSPYTLYPVTSTALKNIRYVKYKVFLASCDNISIPEVNAVYIYYSK
jgi:hypothetical protein